MLDEMRAFSVFAQVGSIQRAADRLCLTQSAVTRQLQRLEEWIGAPLLDRRTKPPRLTSTGRSALERCRAILHDVAELQASASPASEPAGRFRVGVGHALADEAFVACLDDVRARFPRVSVNVQTDWQDALIEMTLQNRLDAAIIPKRAAAALPPELNARAVATEPLVFISGSALSVPAGATLAELAALPWIVKPRATGTREVLEDALARARRASGRIASAD